MPSQPHDLYDFFVGVVIPLAIFLLGLITESRWKIISKFTDKSKTKQSQEVSGERNSPLQLRDNLGVIQIGLGNQNEPGKLPYTEEEFAKKIEKILLDKKIQISFSERYRESYKHVENGHAPLAASTYLSVFLQTKDFFLEKSNYRDDLNTPLLDALENALVQLKDFSDNSKNDLIKLREIVNSVQATLTSLCAYLL